MKVLLKETINSLGIIGSEVVVADGYARNYLLPQGKAIPATIKNLNLIKQERVKFKLQIAKEKAFAKETAAKLEQVQCIVSSKVHEENKLYGSVGIREIIDALEKQNIIIEKRMILLKKPIKTTGKFKVPIRIYADVEPEITIEVIGE